VRLIRLQRQLLWPAEVPLADLRGWIQQQLVAEGELLRWALTAVSADADGGRMIQVEAVISA
jgi:hypothetical protein